MISIFIGLTVFSVIVGLLFIVLDKKLTEMTHGIDGSDLEGEHMDEKNLQINRE